LGTVTTKSHKEGELRKLVIILSKFRRYKTQMKRKRLLLKNQLNPIV
jgi:hypothetical protein